MGDILLLLGKFIVSPSFSRIFMHLIGTTIIFLELFSPSSQISEHILSYLEETLIAGLTFNTRLLSSDVFVQSIANQINTFIEINKTPDISASTLWDTLKAYLRGSVISYTAFERRTREAELSGLMQKIGQLDTIYAANPSPDFYKERL